MHSDTWRPTASLENLRRRAGMLAAMRAFFARRGVLEVETPVLSRAAATDLHLTSFSTVYTGPGAAEGAKMYLHTSPEFAMKRLLAAGSGPIYQICRVFRDGEAGRLHNPEFTMLEWYRPGFDYRQLMDEVEALVTELLCSGPAERLSYAAVFQRFLQLDPHRVAIAELASCAERHGLAVAGMADAGRDAWLDLLLTHLIEGRLGRDVPTFLYDFPATQAALARVREGDPPVAERFELYIDGREIANGYQELTDAAEQRRRFESDNELRRAAGLTLSPYDDALLEALQYGLPACSGVALGVDRLLMSVTDADYLDEVVAFSQARA